MKKALVVILAGLAVSQLALAGALEERLAAYQAEGAGPFSAAAGERMWGESHTSDRTPAERSCAKCHTANLKQVGKHARTGKAIEPLAPSVNAERLTDVAKIEKWFKRNCKWTLGRLCTAQEKGDFLTYIASQ